MLASLPADLAGALLVLQHLSPRHPRGLARIIGDRTGLEVRAAHDDELREATVLVAPPSRHLLLTSETHLA